MFNRKSIYALNKKDPNAIVYSQFFFVHGIEHDINLFSTGTLSIKLVRKKELIHGNLQQGDELIESIKAGVLPPVLDIHDGAWGAVHELG